MGGDIFEASERGDTSEVLRLLAAGADVNGRDARGRTPLMAATHGNHPATVKALIEAGADVDIRDDMTDNPFLYAGAEGMLEILRLAMAAGADPTLTNRYGGSALIPAAERGHVEVVRELLEHSRVDIDHVNDLGWTALLEAVILSREGERQRAVVALLVEHGADVTIADKEGITPLAHARRRGLAEIEKILRLGTRHHDAEP